MISGSNLELACSKVAYHAKRARCWSSYRRKIENSPVACNVLQVFHVSIPFLGPILKSTYVKSSETRLWRSGPAIADLSVYLPAMLLASCLTALPCRTGSRGTELQHLQQKEHVLQVGGGQGVSACSLPWHLAAPHHPHSPLHRHLWLLGPRGRPGLQESIWPRRGPPGVPVCSSSCCCLGVLAPSIHQRQQSACCSRHSRQAFLPAAIHSMLCEHTALTGLALLVPYESASARRAMLLAPCSRALRELTLSSSACE